MMSARFGLGFSLGALLLVSGELAIGAVPPGFPTSGNGLWYDKPAVNWTTQFLPIGNGYLGAMVNGNPTSDRLYLNIESLWSGGPFQDPTYNGGNHQPSEAGYLATQLARIRKTIFDSANGTIPDVRPLPSDAGAYGSYSAAGYFNINRTASGSISNYARWLDLDTAVLKTIWTEPTSSFNRTYFCSNPSHACTVHTIASTPGAFSAIFSLSPVPGIPAPNITCLDSTTLQLRGYAGSPDKSGGAVLYAKGSTEAWLSWVGDTDYSMDTGNVGSGYTFQGVDPHVKLTNLVASLDDQHTTVSLASHVADYQSALGGFSLNLGQKVDTMKTTDILFHEYKTDVGNPYFEWLLFNYGRYMLLSSTRSYLPANLQGKWTRGWEAPWSADYHANINVQMNYWAAEMTNLRVTSSLWEYMAKTWAPRGAETAKTMYNITRGWVVHNEMNIFGHTGMKSSEPDSSAQWADYPEAAAWMMIHVYDHLDYTNDLTWWRSQGWPLLKGIASFWLDHLVEDMFFKDGTLVTAPCNSPEQAITTLGCSHSQQLIWQLFEAVEKGFSVSGDPDVNFLAGKSSTTLSSTKFTFKASFQAKNLEWKVEFDNPTNRHRHLSHLIGLYPGYVLTNFKSPTGQNQGLPMLTREQVLKAAEVSLVFRGNGTGPDGDSGWEKVWRAACWAQLQNSTKFYHQLTYAIQRNFAPNLWSMYYPFGDDLIFQIDANLGYPAAVINSIIQAPDTSSLSDALVVTILPALPAAWANGSITGARIRGGMTLTLTWVDAKPVRVIIQVDDAVRYARQVQIWYEKRQIMAFSATGGLKRELNF
ncbi:glycoside hydrolase family 95 protein [Ceratobasidium sp. AG-Ba]|nr:glycoside hydrolase family 95 protein [Ceratobasidium sp. AG-Ba]